MIDLILEAVKNGHKILIAGNGGLAAESEHFAAEMVGKFAFDVYLPCISLTTNTSLITALANDIGYENVFSHQVEVLGQSGDVFIGMTTSHSPNIVKALETAREKGLKTVLFCGKESFPSDCLIRMNGTGTAEMQNDAIRILHKTAYEIKERCYVSRKSIKPATE